MAVWSRIAVLSFACLAGALTAHAADENAQDFAYGSDCSLLLGLSHQELVATVHPAHSEDFERFCVAKGVYTCSDFNGLLAGIGELEDNGTMGCRFVSSSR